mgnify:FL=1
MIKGFFTTLPKAKIYARKFYNANSQICIQICEVEEIHSSNCQDFKE